MARPFDGLKENEEIQRSEIRALYDETDKVIKAITKDAKKYVNDLFKENNFHIEDVDDEYNPTFMVKFDYIEDYDKMKSVIEDCLSIIDETMENVFKAIEGKEEEYK